MDFGQLVADVGIVPLIGFCCIAAFTVYGIMYKSGSKDE